MLFLSRCCIRGICIRCSRILPGSGSKEIGRKSLVLRALVTLGIGTTVAVIIPRPEYKIV